MTTYRRILDMLVTYRKQGLRYEYVRGVYLPIGELPLSAFQGPEIGGSAANVRLWELRAPEQQKRSFKGIPIKKSRRYYDGHDGARHNTITYTLDLPLDLIDDVLDLDIPCLRKDVLEMHGYTIEEFEDDADGEDKPGQAVRIVKGKSQQLSLVA